LPAELQESIRVGQLSTGHAKVLKGIPDPARQVAVGKEIIARGLSVHALEACLKQMPAGPAHDSHEAGGGSGGSAAAKTVVEKTAHVRSVEDELRQKLGIKLEIRVKGKDRGQLILGFESNDDFERLLAVLRR